VFDKFYETIRAFFELANSSWFTIVKKVGKFI